MATTNATYETYHGQSRKPFYIRAPDHIWILFLNGNEDKPKKNNKRLKGAIINFLLSVARPTRFQKEHFFVKENNIYKLHLN